MANMGYVRFQNTLVDLEDCYEHMDDKLDGAERKAHFRLVQLCTTIADMYRYERVLDEPEGDDDE